MAREAYRSLYGDLTKLKDESNLKDPSGGTDADDQLWELLAAVSRWIDGYCDRHFYTVIETRLFEVEAQDPKLLVTDLIQITTLKTDDDQDGAYETTWATTDYQLMPLNAAPTQHWGQAYTQIRASRLSDSNHEDGFPPGQLAIQIAGEWGYSAFTELSG